MIILQCIAYLLLECPEWIHIPSIVDIPTMLLLSDLYRKFPMNVGKIKLLLRKIFIKKFDRSQHFKRKQLFIYTSKKKKFD